MARISDEAFRELVAAANLVDVAWAKVWPFVSYLPESQSGNAVDQMNRAVVRLMRAYRGAAAPPPAPASDRERHLTKEDFPAEWQSIVAHLPDGARVRIVEEIEPGDGVFDIEAMTRPDLEAYTRFLQGEVQRGVPAPLPAEKGADECSE